MKRRVTPFSFGLAVGLLAMAAGVFVATLYTHQAFALSQAGPDHADFPTTKEVYYTLSDTVDVANTTSMGLVLYHAGAKPATTTTVTVTYQGGAPVCTNQNAQGAAGAHFSYGVAVGGSPNRQTTLSIPAGAPWTANGGGYTLPITATLQDVSCSYDGDHVNFRLNAPAGFILGPESAKTFAIAQSAYCVSGGTSCSPYENYSIPFAPACTVVSNGTATAKIIDMDNISDPVIQPSPATVKVVDTTTGTTVNNNSYTPNPSGEDNGNTASFKFNYIAQHAYTLQINHANENNVLQIQLPFDSVNADINCPPVGDITSSASAACTAITGWMYDPDNSATTLQYYIYVDPASAPAATYASPPGGSNFMGPLTANQANPSGTPGSTPAGHGFKVNVPADVASHGYQGPWAADTYYVYAKDTTSGNLEQIASLNVPAGTCANLTCGTTNFAVGAVGVPITFNVNMVQHGANSAPPGGPTFTIKVTGTGGGTNSQTFNSVPALAPSGGDIYSTNVTFTPAAAGTYTASWSYYLTSGCGSPSGGAGYAPFFQTLGGDVSAGGGFGGTCSQTVADIRSQNLDSPSYGGAGSQMGAWATGNLSNFVSGMGLTGGAATSSGYGLSFANTANTGVGLYGGKYDSVACLPDEYSAKPAVTTTITGALASFGGMISGSYTGQPVAGTFTLGTGADMTLDSGRQVTIYVKGNLFIKSNVLYNYASLANIPRLNIYVQGSIFISPGVSQLHGVYVAQEDSLGNGGLITTCATGTTSAPVAYGLCNSQLTFVGAVMAEGGMHLDRTYGSLAGGGVPNQPAEVFQYSPELWLSAPASSSFQYQSYTSLPPVL